MADYVIRNRRGEAIEVVSEQAMRSSPCYYMDGRYPEKINPSLKTLMLMQAADNNMKGIK